MVINKISNGRTQFQSKEILLQNMLFQRTLQFTHLRQSNQLILINKNWGESSQNNNSFLLWLLEERFLDPVKWLQRVQKRKMSHQIRLNILLMHHRGASERGKIIYSSFSPSIVINDISSIQYKIKRNKLFRQAMKI